MDRFKNALIASVLFTTLLATPVSATSNAEGLHRLTTPLGGVSIRSDESQAAGHPRSC